MAVDIEFLRGHYASLSDEALDAIDRADLVDAARQCYDEEMGRRRPVARPVARPPAAARVSPAPGLRDPNSRDEEADAGDLPTGGDEPDWMDEASEVYSRVESPGTALAQDVANARDFLVAEGIPCYLEVVTEEKSVSPASVRWRVLVPGNLNLRAMGVLERDIFNPEFVAQYETHLETLSDDELREMNPELVFVGLFDRIERVTKAYEDEMARRRLNR
jgi:hypothetical protein